MNKTKAKNKRIAIIKMDEETYIANLYDIISERYIIKEIHKYPLYPFHIF